MRTITFNETELDMIVRALNCKSRRVKSRIANRVKRLADPGIDNDFRANTEEYIRRGGGESRTDRRPHSENLKLVKS